MGKVALGGMPDPYDAHLLTLSTKSLLKGAEERKGTDKLKFVLNNLSHSVFAKIQNLINLVVSGKWVNNKRVLEEITADIATLRRDINTPEGRALIRSAVKTMTLICERLRECGVDDRKIDRLEKALNQLNAERMPEPISHHELKKKAISEARQLQKEQKVLESKFLQVDIRAKEKSPPSKVASEDHLLKAQKTRGFIKTGYTKKRPLAEPTRIVEVKEESRTTSKRISEKRNPEPVSFHALKKKTVSDAQIIQKKQITLEKLEEKAGEASKRVDKAVASLERGQENIAPTKPLEVIRAQRREELEHAEFTRLGEITLNEIITKEPIQLRKQRKLENKIYSAVGNIKNLILAVKSDEQLHKHKLFKDLDRFVGYIDPKKIKDGNEISDFIRNIRVILKDYRTMMVENHRADWKPDGGTQSKPELREKNRPIMSVANKLSADLDSILNLSGIDVSEDLENMGRGKSAEDTSEDMDLSEDTEGEKKFLEAKYAREPIEIIEVEENASEEIDLSEDTAGFQEEGMELEQDEFTRLGEINITEIETKEPIALRKQKQLEKKIYNAVDNIKDLIFVLRNDEQLNKHKRFKDLDRLVGYIDPKNIRNENEIIDFIRDIKVILKDYRTMMVDNRRSDWKPDGGTQSKPELREINKPIMSIANKLSTDLDSILNLSGMDMSEDLEDMGPEPVEDTSEDMNLSEDTEGEKKFLEPKTREAGRKVDTERERQIADLQEEGMELEQDEFTRLGEINISEIETKEPIALRKQKQLEKKIQSAIDNIKDLILVLRNDEQLNKHKRFKDLDRFVGYIDPKNIKNENEIRDFIRDVKVILKDYRTMMVENRRSDWKPDGGTQSKPELREINQPIMSVANKLSTDLDSLLNLSGMDVSEDLENMDLSVDAGSDKKILEFGKKHIIPAEAQPDVEKKLQRPRDAGLKGIVRPAQLHQLALAKKEQLMKKLFTLIKTAYDFREDSKVINLQYSLGSWRGLKSTDNRLLKSIESDQNMMFRDLNELEKQVNTAVRLINNGFEQLEEDFGIKYPENIKNLIDDVNQLKAEATKLEQFSIQREVAAKLSNLIVAAYCYREKGHEAEKVGFLERSLGRWRKEKSGDNRSLRRIIAETDSQNISSKKLKRMVNKTINLIKKAFGQKNRDLPKEIEKFIFDISDLQAKIR